MTFLNDDKCDARFVVCLEFDASFADSGQLVLDKKLGQFFKTVCRDVGRGGVRSFLW